MKNLTGQNVTRAPCLHLILTSASGDTITSCHLWVQVWTLPRCIEETSERRTAHTTPAGVGSRRWHRAFSRRVSGHIQWEAHVLWCTSDELLQLPVFCMHWFNHGRRHSINMSLFNLFHLFEIIKILIWFTQAVLARSPPARSDIMVI